MILASCKAGLLKANHYLLPPTTKLARLCSSSPSKERIVKSPIQDIKIDERHFSKKVWENVSHDSHKQFRTALINGDNGRSYSYKESFALTK